MIDNLELSVIDQDNGVAVRQKYCFIDVRPSTKKYLCFGVMVMQEKMIIEYLVTPIICIKICCLS